MYIPEDREPVKEYSVDDESIRNIIQEISNDEGFQDYVDRLTGLLESVESKKINILINYLLYGMLLNDGQKLEFVSTTHPFLKELLEDYYSALDKVEEALLANKNLQENKFPDLVDSLRMDKEFYKKHRKEINSYVKMLPDIRKNLEDISCRIMGIK